ncbi:MAG: efflux RND transporter periplasmic adaptor subunit [Bryobacteraceae bacterium]
MRAPKKRVFTVAATVAALAVAGSWSILRGHGDTQYRTVLVDKGDIASTVSATGTPNAVVTVQVGTQVSGNILELKADYNTRVKKGQLVARIDPQVFQARVIQATASLEVAKAAVVNAHAVVERAQAELASTKAGVADAAASVLKSKVGVQDAKTKLDRAVLLLKSGVISDQDKDTAQANYDTAVALEQAAIAQQTAAQQKVRSAEADVEVAKTQLATAEAQVKQATAALEQAQLDLSHTYITAPVDGIVVARHVDVGQTVAASLQAPTLFEIAQDLTKMQVDTNVSEADVGRVRVGQQATFTVDAYPGEVFRGQVTQIRQAPINVQNVVTYDVVIGVANTDLKLFPGMTANVRILVDRHRDVLRAPNAALRFRPAEAPSQTAQAGGNTAFPGRGGRVRGPANASTLWVLGNNDKPQPVVVQTGLSDGVYAEITNGALKPGDRVIVAETGKAAAAPVSPGGPGGRRGMGF